MFDDLWKAQIKLFEQIKPDLTKPQLDTLFENFSLECSKHTKKADSIMGYGWLFKTKILKKSV